MGMEEIRYTRREMKIIVNRVVIVNRAEGKKTLTKRGKGQHEGLQRKGKKMDEWEKIKKGRDTKCMKKK